MTATKKQLNALAQKFYDAGHAQVEIDPDEDLKILGIKKVPLTFKSKNPRYGTIRLANGWESFCAYVYEKVGGEPHPGSQARGTGFRSQEYGRHVCELLKKLAENAPETVNEGI
jgi:hypothetical protein